MIGFSQEESFSVIARLIVEIHADKRDFVTHEELVRAIIKDPAGKNLVEAAKLAKGDEKNDQWWASNMIQWFSQKITEHKSEYESKFERRKMEDGYAYKPIACTTGED